MIIERIRQQLFPLRDEPYAAFQRKLIGTHAEGGIIGVRTPALRAYAKQLAATEDITMFLEKLPHAYFEENQLHAFIISGMKDYEKCMEHIDRFLPFVDNWATCDQMSPKVFKKHHKELLVAVRRWLRSEHEYTVRFAIGMLMMHFLDEDYRLDYPEMVADVHRDEYYIKMMQAWYFATALAKQYDSIVPFIENRRLDRWTHNKTIQKAIESYRISDEQKSYLRTLKLK